MKRLLSWLLALTLIISCLPMSVLPAFAAEDVEIETGTSDPDFDVDWSLGELVPLELAPTAIPYTFEITVPAGKTAYYAGASKFAGLVATNNVTGDETTLVVSDDNKVYYNVANNTDAEVTYSITLDYPLGSSEKKVVIDTMLMSKWGGGYSDSISIKEGNSEGYYYTYTAEADGTMTVYFTEVPSGIVTSTSTAEDGTETTTETEVDYTCDIVVNNTATYASYSLLKDGVDNNGLELVIEVTEGTEYFIQIIAAEDHEGNWYPAANVSWAGNLVPTPGTEANPVDPWVWNDDYTEASATVTVPAGQTLWFTSSEEMILTVDGAVVEQSGKFSISNSGDAEATYNLSMTYPVGSSQNPEIIDDIDGYSDVNSTVEDGSYYYIWTASEDGTVTLDVTDGANLVVEKLTYVDGQDWPNTEQFVLAEYAYTDDWSTFLGWTVAENLVIDVVAGEQLKIQVTGYSNTDAWSVPPVNYTLTGEFEAAIVAPEYNVVTSGYGLSLEAELVVSAKFAIPDELYNDADAVIKVQFIDQVTEYKMADFTRDSKDRILIEQSVRSPWMPHMVTVTITDGQGNVADYIDYFGDTHEGSYEFGAETYVKLTTVVDPGESTINCIRGLLTYGAYAQEYFESTGTIPNIPEMRATEILTKYGYEPMDISQFSSDLLDQAPTSSGDSFDGISSRGVANPVLEAAIYMTFQFNATGITEADMDNYTYKLSYMSGNTLVEKEISPSWDSRGRLVFNITDIAAMYFDCMYSVTITKKATGESYTGSTSIIAYMDVAFTTYEGVDSQVKFLNLLKAMYYYNQAANAHFNK